MASTLSSWTQHHWSGSAGDFHELSLGNERAVWWCDVERPALIVGSSQSTSLIDFDCASQKGIDVVRRHSGGGLVYVHPTESVWIDITIPRDDDLWTDDVSTSMLWVGDAFVRAVSPWMIAATYRERFSAGEFGRDVCFASTSPGEVFVGEHKLVGISQRRTRNSARFQCVLYRTWLSDRWLDCVDDHHARVGAEQLQPATLNVNAGDIVAALVNSLPS